MKTLLKAMWIWGIGDSVWMAIDPSGWSRFWGRFIALIGRSPGWSKAMAVTQFGLSLYMLRRSVPSAGSGQAQGERE